MSDFENLKIPAIAKSMYEEVKIIHNMATVFMLNDRKNPVARYRSFLDTL